MAVHIPERCSWRGSECRCSLVLPAQSHPVGLGIRLDTQYSGTEMGKRHHYVPRFYLKAFASAPKRIHLLNLRREQSLANVSLRDQCYSHRLYGQDDELEDAFATLESAASPLLTNISEHACLPRVGSDEHQLLLTFLSLQLSRTLAAQQQGMRMSATLGNAVFNGSPPSDWELSPADAMLMMLSTAGGMRDTLADLEMLLVQAPDSSQFATSDNPVFRYNMYCEGVKHFGVTGTTQLGFQIFFPLSPSLTLHLFDAGVYKAGSRKRSNGVIRATADDVLCLNRLQLVSAGENVYFNDWSVRGTLMNMLSNIRRLRAQSRPHINVAVSDADKQHELIHQYWPMPQIGLRLSFLTFRRNARRTPLFERSRLIRPPYQKAPIEHSGPSQRYTVRRRI